jgi:hypothetical protein
MSAYFALFVAVLSRLLPGMFHMTGLGFTAVGGGLLFFGARRSRSQAVIATLALMATDFYLTTYVYHYAFRPSHYLVTWGWYAAVCLMGHEILGKKSSFTRVTVAVLASATSFFVLSNLAVWAQSTLYTHTLAGLSACYVASIPFYANDVISTAMTAGAFFGLPALAADIVATWHSNPASTQSAA